MSSKYLFPFVLIFALLVGLGGGAAPVQADGDPPVFIEEKVTASDGHANDEFGISVAVAGDTALVGAYHTDNDGNVDQGSAYVFVRNGTNWTQQAKLTASDGAGEDNFGISVAVSDDTALVGAYHNDINGNDQGSAYVFVRNGTTWTQEAQLTALDGAEGDNFGRSVAISGNTAVVGAHWDDVGENINQGSAYVFVRSGTTWTQQAQLTASNGASADYFGVSVALDGDTALVGGDGVNVGSTQNQGSAYVFVRSGATWTQQTQLSASNGTAYDFLGFSVALSGDTALAGAPGYDYGSKVDQGSAWIFVRSGTTWSQQTQLLASDGMGDDDFGWSVALLGDTAVVGARLDDIGTNTQQGSAYLFLRSGTIWGEQTKVTSSDGAAADYFGTSVSLAASGALVGAKADDVGSNSDQGSAYFYMTDPGPTVITFRSVGTYDGWLLESSETSNKGGSLDKTGTTFRLGDDASDKQYRAILHFNTEALPDTTVITKVTLKIKKQGLTGTNPFTILGGLKVDMRKPYFGTSLDLVVGDFQATAGKSAVATFGATSVNNWYSAVLNATGRAYVNLSGTTQFRLRFATDDNNDNGADYMKFYSGNAGAASRPQLIVEYYVP